MESILVLLTMTVTAYLFHDLVGLPLAVGFVSARSSRRPTPWQRWRSLKFAGASQIIVILEGESLINDATSFISFRFRSGRRDDGVFSLEQASLQFLFVATGASVLGSPVGWLATQLQKRLEIACSNNVLSAYAATRLLQRRKLLPDLASSLRHLYGLARPALF